MKRMQPLSRKELLSVLRAAREHSQRDFCLLLLTFAHGLRASEAAGLRVSDMDTRNWAISIARKKGSLKTLQSLSPNSEKLLDERKALTHWLAMRPSGTPFLFPSRKNGSLTRVQVYRLFRDYAVAAGLPESKRGIHALKHSLATMMVQERQDIARVQQALGHASIGSTAQYFRVTDAMADEARHAALFARM